jgi:hypothetical protein
MGLQLNKVADSSNVSERLPESHLEGHEVEANFRVSRRKELRILVMLLLPLALLVIAQGPARPRASIASPISHHKAPASILFQQPAPPPVNPNLAPPSNLQVVRLDSSFHLNWTPSTDPLTQWHVVSVWDNASNPPTLQQSKVVGRTAGVAQTNGILPDATRSYTLKVQAMDAQGNLSAPATAQANPDPQSPMRNAAFFENFNGSGNSHGPLDPNYFSVRTEHITNLDFADDRLAFNNESHYHTQLIGAGPNGGMFVRPRVPFDFTNRTGTMQFETDIAPVQHSHGKWWTVHLTRNLPSLPSVFGLANGEEFEDSIEFAIYKGAAARTTEAFNIPVISVNIGGTVYSFEGDPFEGLMTATNVRVPVVIRVSRTSAEMFVNGVSAVRATGFTLPFTTGHWLFGHMNYGSDKVDWDQNPPTILQLAHWETIQYDGPTGSYNPLVRTYIQPGCDGSVDDGHNVILDCPAFVDSGQRTNSFTFNIDGEANASLARSARLIFYGSSARNLTVNINGNTGQATVAPDGGIMEQVNVYDFPVNWLRQGSNQLTVTTTDSSLDGLAQFEIEVIFNQNRVMPTPPPALPSHQMIALTSNNYRIEHISGNLVHTVTTNIYNAGSGLGGPVTYNAEIVWGQEWLNITPASGTVQQTALGGGVRALTIRADLSRVGNSGEVGIIKVNGGAMPAYIGIFALHNDAPSTFVTIDPSHFINDFNKSAIPDYHGAGSPTFTPAPPAPTRTPTGLVPTATRTRTRTATIPAANTTTPAPPPPTSASSSTVTPTFTPLPTSTAFPNLCEMTFVDVPRDHWAWNYIMYMACQGMVGGYSDGTFRPNNEISRGQIAKVVSNAAGFNDPPGAQMYEDVSPSNTFYVWINRLSMRGLLGGYACGGPGEPCGQGNLPYFRPYASVSRGQIAKIVSNTAGFNDPPGAQMFEDVPPSQPFFIWIQRLASRGMMTGYPCGTFSGFPCQPPLNRPYFLWSGNATRAQTAKIVYTALIAP